MLHRPTEADSGLYGAELRLAKAAPFAQTRHHFTSRLDLSLLFEDPDQENVGPPR